jgi:hypothetical protein
MMPPRRSRFLLLLTALLSIYQFVAAYRAITVPAAISTQITLPLQLDFVMGVVWGGIFAWSGAALWRRGQDARFRSLFWIGVFIIYAALRLALFAQADYERLRYPFLLAAGAAVLLILALLRLWRRFNGHNQPQKADSPERAD